MSDNKLLVKKPQCNFLGLFLGSVLLLGLIINASAQIDDELYKVSVKQKKKLTLIAVKNNSEESIFGVKLSILDGYIKFVKAKNWDRNKVDQNTVIVSSNDTPLTSARSLIIILITDKSYSSLQLSLLDDKQTPIYSKTIDLRNQVETEFSVKLNKNSYYTGETMVISGTIPPKSLFHAQTVDPGDPHGQKRGHKGLGGTASTSGFADEKGNFREFLLVSQTAYPGIYEVKVRVFDSIGKNLLFEKTLPFEIKEWPKPIAVITNLEEYYLEGDFFFRNVDIIAKGQPLVNIKITVTDPLGRSVFTKEGQADNNGLFLQSYLLDVEKGSVKGNYTITASQRDSTAKWTFKVL